MMIGLRWDRLLAAGFWLLGSSKKLNLINQLLRRD